MEAPKKTIDPNKARLSTGAKVAIGVGSGAVGTAGMCVAAPVLLEAAGFGSSGIVARSPAAAVMSFAGPVPAGGMFATLQSAGMAGLGALGFGLAGTVGAALGSGLGTLAAFRMKRKLSKEDIKEAFFRNVSSSNGELQYHELKHLVQNDLNVDITDESLFEVYKDITRNEDYGTITLNQVLLMFGFNSEKESKGNEDSFRSNYELFRKFKEFDDDDDGLISYEQFWDSLDDMKIEFSSVEMRKIYTSVTGSSERPFRQIDFQNYVKIINMLQ